MLLFLTLLTEHTHSHTLTGVEHHYHPVPIDEEYYTAKLIRDHDDTRKEKTKKRRNHQQLYIPISRSEQDE